MFEKTLLSHITQIQLFSVTAEDTRSNKVVPVVRFLQNSWLSPWPNVKRLV